VIDGNIEARTCRKAIRGREEGSRTLIVRCDGGGPASIFRDEALLGD
jgi:hypothetical protein